MTQTNSLPVDQCPDGFGNSNGKLVCDAPKNADGIPDGTYKDSCGGCKLEGDELSCSHCQKGGGEHQASTIKADECTVIGNNHGQLVCEDKKDDSAKAEGSDKKDEL